MPDPEKSSANADLDDLLELFREPEEEPRRRGKSSSTVCWILALLLSLSAVWLTYRTATADSPQRSLTGPMKPTKASLRSPDVPVRDRVDAVADYIARCEKGLTRQEVQWIVGDFQKAGLDLGLRSASPEEFIRQRKAQHAWYLDLLSDGLHLNPEQRQAAAEKLAALLEEAALEFRAKLDEAGNASLEHEGRRFRVVDGSVIRKLIEAPQWLNDERYAPWELCELTEEQKLLTWFGWINSRRNADPDSLIYEPDMPWLGDRMLVGGPSAEGTWTLADFPTGAAPTEINGAGVVFPFMIHQRFGPEKAEHPGPLEAQAMGCHPGQLKTLLLLMPEIGQSLLERLDESGP